MSCGMTALVPTPTASPTVLDQGLSGLIWILKLPKHSMYFNVLLSSQSTIIGVYSLDSPAEIHHDYAYKFVSIANAWAPKSQTKRSGKLSILSLLCPSFDEICLHAGFSCIWQKGLVATTCRKGMPVMCGSEASLPSCLWKRFCLLENIWKHTINQFV